MEYRDNQFGLQDRLYAFPYHYLPTLDASGAIAIHRSLSWGLDYLTYMSFAVDLITRRLEARSILDVGCGDARLLHMLRDRVPRRAGVDLSEKAILFARAFNPETAFFVGDVSLVPGRFHAVALIEVMEHIPDEDSSRFISAIAKKTAPEGRLIVSVPTTNVPLNRKHYRHYDIALLESHLAPDFLVERHWYLSKRGSLLRLWNWLLRNQIAIVLPGVWRRAVWSLHRRYTYFADVNNGTHLVAVAKPST